jgi:hypothetical protein
MLLIHRRAIVQPVEIRYVLRIGARFHQLFSAAMQQADVRIDSLDHFAVQLKHQAQNAVGSRVASYHIEKGENKITLKTSIPGIYFIEVEGTEKLLKWLVE